MSSTRILNADVASVSNGDLTFVETNHVPTNILPLFVDLRQRMPPVPDQGTLGTNTAQILCSTYRYVYPQLNPSPLFTHYNIQEQKNVAEALKIVQKTGFCAEENWPYNAEKVDVKPSEVCYTNSLAKVVVRNVRQDLNSMLNALNEGIPFFATIAVYPAFTNVIVAKTGKIPLPARDAKPIGGQVVLVCGYDSRTQMWQCQNSWGKDWGEKGYCSLPFLYLLDTSLCSDLWCFVKA